MKMFFNFIVFLALINSQNNYSNEKQSIPLIDGRPSFYQGLYISNSMARNKMKLDRLLDVAVPLGINSLVIDVQGGKLPEDLISRIQSRNIHGIARVVVFHLGLTTEFPTKEHRDKLVIQIQNACNLGFKEINLDYIRYSDGGWNFKASFEKRYANMQSIIRDLRTASSDRCGSNVKWGTDVFGRVPFIQNDAIGQRIEEYSEVVDLIYPMLYPSHFYGMKDRQGDPYNTVKEGLELTIQRSTKTTDVVTWVQGFQYYIGPSGLSFQEYIKLQMQAALDSKSRGFVVWNAENDYFHTLKALEEFKKDNNL